MGSDISSGILRSHLQVFTHNRGIIDYARSPRHDRDEILGEVEERVDVDVEDVTPLIMRKISDSVDLVLRCVIVGAGHKHPSIHGMCKIKHKAGLQNVELPS